jgi:hypothetical protein
LVYDEKGFDVLTTILGEDERRGVINGFMFLFFIIPGAEAFLSPVKKKEYVSV